MSTITINPGADIQSVIDSAPSGTTVVFTPGVYSVSNVIDLKSGVSLEGQSGAELLSNGNTGIFEGLGIQNVTISGFIFDGNNGGPASSGAIYLDSSTGDSSGTPSNDIQILNNTFQNWTNSTGSDLWLWLTQNTYIEGNTFQNGNQAISWSTPSGSPDLNNLVISNNVITGMKLMGIETGFDSNISNIHIDYNTISNIGDMSISFVEGQTGGGNFSGTVWGNHIDGINSGGTLVELGNFNGGADNITVSQNVLANASWGMMFSHTTGMAVLDNTFTNVQNPFSDDGGYDGTEWIGTNTVDGVAQDGWSWHGAYGAEPTLQSPSTPLPGVNNAGSSTATTATDPTTAATTSTVTATDAASSTSTSTVIATDSTSSASASTATVTDPTTIVPTSATSGTTNPLLAPFQQSTLLGSFGSTAGFLQSTAGTAEVSASTVSGGSGALTQLAGGQLTTDLTNIGSLNAALTAGGAPTGTGTQTQPVSGIGAAFSNLDHGSKQHDALNADTWRHA